MTSINFFLLLENDDDDHSSNHAQHVESFYLRIGAIAFGIGTMVYSGLELGHFFELRNVNHVDDCVNVSCGVNWEQT